MIEQQLNIFDKQKVKLIKDCTTMNPGLTKNSIQEVYLEQEGHYIILIDNVFYGVFKCEARKC